MLEPNRNRANGCWKRKTGLEKVLSVCCLVFTVIAVLSGIWYLLEKPCNREKECRTKHCVKAAAELLEFIDLKENPCENFYRFVCGTYYKNAIKKSSPSPLITINNEFENEMKAIIVDPIHKKDTKANILIKQFYHECMNTSKIDSDRNEAFIRTINELGGWPLLNRTDWNVLNFDWVELDIKAKRLGLTVLGFFNFNRVVSKDNHTVLEVSRLPKNYLNIKGISEYNTAMKQVIEALGGVFDEKDNEDVYEFIKKVKKYQEKSVREDLKGILKHLLAFTPEKIVEVKPMQNLIDDCPSIPWLKLLNSIAGNEVQFNNSTPVSFESMKSYCLSLDKLLKSTHPRIIANYYISTILQQLHHYLGRNLRNALENIQDTYVPRYKVCLNEAENRFKYVRETIYVRRRTPKIVKGKLTEMIDIMKNIFIEHLKEGDWMDDKTKQAAIEKTQLIESVIGGEEELYNVDSFDKILGVDEFNFTSDNFFEMGLEKRKKETQHFFETLYGERDANWPSFFKHAVQLNAFFYPSLNLMVLPAPILSSIFYDSKKPAFMNYGSIGRVIAHEIMHGFEKSGREVLLQNDEIKNWWTDETANAYDKKVQCVIDEYERIPFRYRMNGTLTLDENLSDLVGIDVAYESYLKYIAKYGEEKKIPGVPLTPKQIFWIQTGTFLCFRKLDDNEQDYEKEEKHAIPAFRVEGGAKNSKYFAKDFNCPVGSRMNPENKCRVL